MFSLGFPRTLRFFLQFGIFSSGPRYVVGGRLWALDLATRNPATWLAVLAVGEVALPVFFFFCPVGMFTQQFVALLCFVFLVLCVVL